MAFRLLRPETAFAAPRQKRPRQKTEDHLRFLRRLCCAVPGCTRGDIHAAHIRAASPLHGKRETGAGEKPDDAWCIPCCSHHHVFGGPDAQHSQNELAFWAGHGIDPFALALALWKATGNDEAGLLILRATQRKPV